MTTTALLGRGPLSTTLLDALAGSPAPAPRLIDLARSAVAATASTLEDEDIQAALTLLYELHYRGLPGVDDRWEWQPDLLATAGVLEEAFERDIRTAVADRLPALVAPTDVASALAALIAADDGPSLSKYLANRSSQAQFAEFLIHRSIYHLKEADPHSFAIPRLSGAAKAALVEIQSDEYGAGDADRMHAALFARCMRSLGLDDSYGGYLNSVPAVTLAWANAMTLFGLHRRLRGAIAGHLAALEMTSSLPNRRYGNGLRRLGFDQVATWFFDEHVEADAVHEQIAAHDLAGRLAVAEPALTDDIVMGAAAALVLDARVAAHLLSSWAADRSSLLDAAPQPDRTDVRDGDAVLV